MYRPDEIPRILERNDELARIEAAIDAAREGRGTTLVIEGPAGIGKTELLRAAERSAGSDFTTLRARATALEREFGFGVVRQLLEPPLRSASAKRKAELLEGGAGRAASALGLGEPATRPDPGGFSTLNGLYWLVASIAERRPLLLAVDDAHWADADSMRMLTFLAPRLPDLPVLLLLTARTEEWRPDPALAATASDAGAHSVRPAPLSVGAVEEIVRDALGADASEAFCRACHEVTGGNPFYLRGLIEELERENLPATAESAEQVRSLSPRAVVQSTMARLPALGDAASPLALAVAVLGESATRPRVAALAELGEKEARSASQSLAAASFLELDTPLRFSHPIIRNAVYESVSRAHRQSLHERAARLLAAEGAGAERIAPHLLAVEPREDESALTTLRQAAARALGRGASDAAAAYLRRALIEPPPAGERVDVLFELACAEMLVGGEAAIGHLFEAIELEPDAERRAAIATVLARALIFADRGVEAADVADRAIDDLGDSPAEACLRRALLAMVLAVAKTEPLLAARREALATSLRDDEGIEAPDAGAKALLVGLAYLDAQACEPAERIVPMVERGLEGGALLEHDNGGADFIAAVMVLAMADSELALPLLAEGAKLARERGDVFAWGADRIFACLVHLLRGEIDEAVGAGEEGLAASDSYGIAVGLSWGGGYVATAHLERGDLDAAERTLARARAPEPIPGHGFWAPFVDARARVHLAGGRPRQALDDSLACGRLLEQLGIANPALAPWRSRAALCLTSLEQDEPRARGLAAEEVELARAWGAPRALGVALRAQGLVIGDEQGIELLAGSVDVLEGSPARLEHARSLVELGAAIRRQGRRRDCREPLREGMDAAWRCGARALAERARSELRAAGARPRRLMLSGRESLTPSERRVASMAADGLTNREIAQALFLTTKTVESHLSATFRKLEISSREELPRALQPDRDAATA